MADSHKKSQAFTYYELLEACALTGCPVCRVGAVAAHLQLKSLFGEYVNDRDLRGRLVRDRGFCKEHAQLLLEHRIADTLGAVIIYEHILKQILREFPEPASAKIRSAELSSIIDGFTSASPASGSCLACDRREEASKRALLEMSRALNNEKLQQALQSSDGLCFPHLSEILKLLHKQEDVEYMLNFMRHKLQARQAEMAEVIRKNDHRFRSEKITHEEAIAWRKAMCMLTGATIHPTGEKHG